MMTFTHQKTAALLYIGAFLLLSSCRPHPEEADIGTFLISTPDATTGLSTLSAEAGSLYALSDVFINNGVSDESSQVFSDSNGSLLTTLATSIGDVITLQFTDADGLNGVSTLVVPLQQVAYHGTLSLDGSCLIFTRDDLADGDDDTALFEVVGEQVEQIEAILGESGQATGTLSATPILFGASDCELPLLDAGHFREDGAEGQAFALHGQIQNIGGCKAFLQTTHIPFPSDSPPIEDPLPSGTPQTYFYLVDQDGNTFATEPSAGSWLSISGNPAGNAPAPCDMPIFRVSNTWEDTGQYVEVFGQLATTSEASCLSLSTGEGTPWSIVGPLLSELQSRPIPPENLLFGGYPLADATPDACGRPLVLAGLPHPPQGAPPQGEGAP